MNAHFMRRQLVAAVENRDSPTVIDRLTGSCWPGGQHDRHEPVAVEWLKRWRPLHATIGTPACTCASGRCRICN